MEKALDGTVLTHQDAINAAYLAVGWRWGQEPADGLDRVAFRKARSWGFRIEQLVEARDAPFLFATLHDGPLVSRDVTVAESMKPVPRRGSRRHHRRRHRRAVEVVQSAPRSAEDELLAQVARRLDEVERTLARIDRELDAVSAEALPDGEARLARARSLYTELERLAATLDGSQRYLGTIDAELRTMAARLGMR